MEEDRRGKTDRINAVQHAAVALDHRSPVLDAAIALDGGEDEAAKEAEDVDGQRDERGLPWREGRE